MDAWLRTGYFDYVRRHRGRYRFFLGSSLMGKRSEFKRRPQDRYNTPEKAVEPLLPHLAPSTPFIEPCPGRGHLIRWLENAGHVCMKRLPQDARTHNYNIPNNAYVFITNPPWTRDLLHPIIENLRQQAPTWLLIDADWMHTQQASPYLKYCSHIVSIGRVRWIAGTDMDGKDNACWYRFSWNKPKTIFISR